MGLAVGKVIDFCTLTLCLLVIKDIPVEQTDSMLIHELIAARKLRNDP